MQTMTALAAAMLSAHAAEVPPDAEPPAPAPEEGAAPEDPQPEEPPADPAADAAASEGELVVITPAHRPTPPPAPPASDAPIRARHNGEGDALMITVAAISGGVMGTGTAIGIQDGADESAFWGGFLGSHLGGATALVLRPEGGYTADDAVLVGSGALIGTWAGDQIARTLIPPGAERETGRIALAGTLGNLAGTGAALAVAGAPHDAKTLLHADLAALVGWQAALGGADLLGLDPQGDRQPRAAISLLGGLGAGAGSLAASAADLPPPSPALVGLGVAQGGWIGLWSPLLVAREPTDLQRVGALRLGLGAGYLGSVALAGVVRPDPQSASLQAVGAVAGNALGAGLPMALGRDPFDDPAAVVAPMLSAGVAGQVYGAVLSRYATFDRDTYASASILGLWSGWQTVGWALYGDRAFGGGPRATGYALTAAGASALVGMGVAPVAELTPSGAALTASGGVWGTWYGGWLGAIADLDPDTHWLVTLGASNAALVGTFAGVVGREPGWGRVGLIDGFGALGGAGGALVGVVSSTDPDVVGACALAGSTIGLAVGSWRAARAEDGDVRLPSFGLRLPERAPRLAARPFRDAEGGSGVWVGFEGRSVQ